MIKITLAVLAALILAVPLTYVSVPAPADPSPPQPPMYFPLVKAYVSVGDKQNIPLMDAIYKKAFDSKDECSAFVLTEQFTNALEVFKKELTDNAPSGMKVMFSVECVNPENPNE